MAISSKTIVKHDLDRLTQAAGVTKDSSIAIDNIIQVIRSETSIITFPNLRGFQEYSSSNKKRFGKDFFVQLLEELQISETQWLKIEAIAQKWAVIHDNPVTKHNLIKSLVDELSHFLSCRTQSIPTTKDGLWDFSLVFPNIHLNYFDDEVHLIVVSDPQAAPNEFENVKNIIRDNDALMKVTLLLVLGNGDELRELAKNASIEIVVLDENDCKSILMSSNSKQMFCHRVARRITIQALQPYQTQGKVRNRMFYGRYDEIKRLKSNLSTSFAIYGGRLIGKSSLLHRIAREFEQDESKAYRVCSITAQGFNSPTEVCRAILKKLNIPTGNYRSVLTFERLIRDNLTSHSKRFLILIDEVDDLIALDEEAGNQLFETFHNLNNDFGERCRFVFVGYRDLARHCMDSKSRFRNFAETIRLGNLDKGNARLLIQEPMCTELGYSFDSDELIEKILEITARHPNYIQIFCKELTEYLDQRHARRVREDDINHILHNADFRARVVETFYVNFSSLQQLIIALIIVDEKQNFDLPEVVESLREFGLSISIKDVYAEFRQLEMSFVIEQVEGGRYCFIHQLFPEMLKTSVNLNSLAYILLKEAGA